MTTGVKKLLKRKNYTPPPCTCCHGRAPWVAFEQANGDWAVTVNDGRVPSPNPIILDTKGLNELFEDWKPQK